MAAGTGPEHGLRAKKRRRLFPCGIRHERLWGKGSGKKLRRRLSVTGRLDGERPHRVARARCRFPRLGTAVSFIFAGALRRPPVSSGRLAKESNRSFCGIVRRSARRFLQVTLPAVSSYEFLIFAGISLFFQLLILHAGKNGGGPFCRHASPRTPMGRFDGGRGGAKGGLFPRAGLTGGNRVWYLWGCRKGG